jgi:transcriptional regulator with XRE-family HTH domain
LKSKPHLPRVSQDIDLYAGCQLRKRRKELNLTQKEIANFLGITFQQVQKYENGSNRICASRLYTLCNLLNVGPSYFFKNFTYTSSYKEEESFLSDVNAADGSN